MLGGIQNAPKKKRLVQVQHQMPCFVLGTATDIHLSIKIYILLHTGG